MRPDTEGAAVGDTPPRRRIDSLQAARGISAAMVVLFHARDCTDATHGRALLDWLVAPTPSFIDVFFIISGFIMVTTTRREPGALVFAIRRATRIWPSYAVVTLLYVAALSALAPVIGGALPTHFAPGAILRALLFLPADPGGDPPFFGFPPLHVGWTLNYEAYFYAVFTLSLLFRRARHVVLFAVLLGLLVVPPVLAGRLPTSVVWRQYHFGGIGILSVGSSPMVWDFLAGCVLALVHGTRIRFPSTGSATLAIAVAAAFGIWLQWDNWASTFGPRACLSWLPLLASLVIAEKTIGLKVPAFLVRLGEISFSLYLVHPLVTDALGNALKRYRPLGLPVGGVPFALFLLACSVALAAMSHALLERRLSTWLRDRLLALAGARGRGRRISLERRAAP